MEELSKMDIRFQINGVDYALGSDSRQFILYDIRDKPDTRTGKPQTLMPKHFYPKIEFMLDDLYQMGLRDNNVKTFRELLKHSGEIKKQVDWVAKQLDRA